MMLEESCDIAIVGGGPAGASAALTAHAGGLNVCLLDEQARLGGQIYRQPPSCFKVSSWLQGRLYDHGKALVARAEQLSGLRHIPSATVCALFPGPSGGHRILFHDNQRFGRITARCVLLATGCYELPVPFQGWHLPGVMSAGGIQTLLKSQRVAAGSHIVLAGSHPLLFVVAEQLLQAGIRVAAISIAQPLRRATRVLKSPLAVWAARRPMMHLMASYAALRRARVPVLFGHAVFEAVGEDRVEAVRIAQYRGKPRERELTCDALGVCYGFTPSSELARQAGASHRWLPGGGWVVQADEFGRTSVSGLYVAGELTGVAGAEAAALSGEIAGIAMALEAGRLSRDAGVERVRGLRRRLGRVRQFASVLSELAQPPAALVAALARPTALACRCEDVTIGTVTEALKTDETLASASTVKLRTRVGMGPCQGRMCELTVRRLIAAQRGCLIEDVAGYTIRAPVKPMPLALLASDPRALEINPTEAANVRCYADSALPRSG